MQYSWITNIKSSLSYALSGYLSNQAEIAYKINSTGESWNINLVPGFPATSITDPTVAIYNQATPNLMIPNQIGSGWTYRLNVIYDVFTKTDRDVEVVSYEICKHLRNPQIYYNWDYVVTSGFGVGITDRNIYIDNIYAQRIRANTTETNEFLKHRGRVYGVATVDSDSLIN